jgi:hypothetical protein
VLNPVRDRMFTDYRIEDILHNFLTDSSEIFQGYLGLNDKCDFSDTVTCEDDAGLPPPESDSELVLYEDNLAFSYAEAKARCTSEMGGVLAKIAYQADYDTVAGLIAANSYTNKQAWIGLNDLDVEGEFRWVEDDSELGKLKIIFFFFSSYFSL